MSIAKCVSLTLNDNKRHRSQIIIFQLAELLQDEVSAVFFFNIGSNRSCEIAYYSSILKPVPQFPAAL